MSKERENQKTGSNVHQGTFLQSIKGKVMLMGIMAILVAGGIGCVGIMSVNNNVRNSDIAATTYEIDVLRSQNQEYEALFQYHVEQTYLDQIITNLDKMSELVAQLQTSAGNAYKESVQTMQDAIAKSRENDTRIIELNNSRGFDTSTGVYSEYTAAGKLYGSGE